jgi:hypothetical protein
VNGRERKMSKMQCTISHYIYFTTPHHDPPLNVFLLSFYFGLFKNAKFLIDFYMSFCSFLLMMIELHFKHFFTTLYRALGEEEFFMLILD